jgi:hypothetical protein
MDKRAAWASIALMALVAGCGGSRTQDQAMTEAGGVPIAIASIAAQGNEAIAVDSQYVYIAGPGLGLVRVPVSGGTPDVLSDNVSMIGLVPALAVDAENVYWSAQSCATACQTVLLSQPLAGGTNTQLSRAGQNVLDVTADGQNVYWLEQQSIQGQMAADGSVPGSVMMRDPAGGVIPVTVAPARFLYSGGRASIAVDSNVIYWTDGCPANSVADCGGELMKVPVAGGTPVQLATWSGFSYSQIKVGPGGVYFAVPVTQSSMQPPPPTGILRVPLAGGDPVMVSAPPALAITLDDANIYWTDYTDMMKAPLPSGAPATRAATTTSTSFDLAVDATSLYWVDTGTLMKLTPK